MNYWIFTAASFSRGDESYTARDIYLRRMQDRFWGLGERTPNRRRVAKGDQIVFYIARPESAFGGTATLASESFRLTTAEQEPLAHGSEFFRAEYGVWLVNIETWDRPTPVAALASTLELIEDPRQWWAYLQGGIREISEKDYFTILGGIPEQAPATRPDLADQSLFALESHLEEFIAHNWAKIPWGATLKLYQDGEVTGRQYPAGPWSIDFLAVDSATNDFVVIELKRGKTSDATVGQVLRYMSWVRQHIAANGQNVRGIIVASEVDAALRYAAKDLAGVAVTTYAVSFALRPVDL